MTGAAGREGLCSPVPEGVVRSPQGGQTGAEAVKPRLAIAARPRCHVDPGSRGAERQPPAVPGASRPHIRTPHSSDLLPPGQLQRAEKSIPLYLISIILSSLPFTLLLFIFKLFSCTFIVIPRALHRHKLGLC